MSDTTPDIDKYENADWWTVFRATQLCRELKRERDEARRERDEAREELASLRKGLVRLIRRWKRREKEYLNAVTPAFQMGDKCAGNRYYGESIGTHWAIEDLEILAKRKEEAK